MEKRNFKTNPVKVFLAVGHSGPDPGAVKGDIREAACNLTVALTVRQELERHGMQVLLSRYTDVENRLPVQIAQCNQFGPELAMAIHTNAGGGSGFEVLCKWSSWANNAIVGKLTQYLQKRIASYCGMPVRETRFRNDLGWLNQVQAPTVLCENFFIDGPNADRYSEPDFLKRIGQAYAMAVLDLYGIPYQSDKSGMVQFYVWDQTGKKQCSCSGKLQNGSHWVPMRKFAQLLGFDVRYDEQTTQIDVYLPEFYAESLFAGSSQLLRRSAFPSQAEQILNGVPDPVN